jgi:hypothetical protein
VGAGHDGERVVAQTNVILVWDTRALLPVTDPFLLNQDLMEEIRGLREQIQSLERRLKELESKTQMRETSGPVEAWGVGQAEPGAAPDRWGR